MVPFFSHEISYIFVEATRSFKMPLNDCSRFDVVAPQDLGVLESSQQPWHRKSSGCPREWWYWRQNFEGFLEAVEAVDRMQWLTGRTAFVEGEERHVKAR